MALPTISLRDPQASTPITDDELYRGTTSVLRQGWNSGLKGVGSQLNSVAGLAGEVLGADEFAQNRNADALRLREEAAALAPTIGKWSQVNGLRDFGDYAAGLIGGSAPVSLAGIGAAAATGGGAVPAMLAAGAVNVLPEMGDVIQKQQADPEAMRLSAGERFGSAALGGLGSAAFQGVVPGLVGGKLMGQGAQAAARQSFKGVLAKDVLGASALEGVAEGGGDVVKQYAANPNAAVDWESAKENAIGGAVAGGAMGSIGAAGDLTSRVGPQVGNALSSARTSIKERISGASDAAVDSPAGKKVKSAYDDVAEMVEKGRAKFDDTVGKMLRGEELGVDPAEWAKATTDEAKARLTALSDSEGVKAATKWAKEMLDDVGLDAGKRQEVADAMANVAEKGGQMAMAGLRQTWEASKSAASKLDGLMQDLGGKYRGARAKRNNADVDVESSWVDEPGAEPGEFPQLGAPAAEAPKKSMNARREFIDKLVSEGVSPDDARAMYVESMNKPRAEMPEPPKFSRDYSGVEQSILNALTANGLSQRRPDLFEDPRNRQKLGASLRQVLDQITTGQLDAKVVRKLTNLLGDDTEGMINSMRRAVKGDLDAGEAESFFKNINTLRDAQQSSEELNTQLKSLMSPEAVKQFGSGFSLMETADLGMAFARGELVSAPDANNRSAKELSASDIATNAKVKEFFVQRFGDKADAALDLIGESVGMKRTKEGDFAATVMDEDGNMKEAGDASFNEKGERQSAENLDVVYVGAGKDDRQGDKGKAELMMHPDLFKSSKQPGMNRAQQAMMNAKDRFSKDGGDPRTVRFEYAEGSTTHGHVVAERAADPEGLSEQDVKAMKNDSKAFSRSPDRIDIPASKATGGEPIAIDTWKVAHVMHGRLERGALDNNSTPERMARMFIEGVARLTEKYGTFTIPDKVRIARLNGVDLTWGEAKKLGKTRRTAADRAYDRNTEQMNDARKELMSLKPGDDARRYELESLIKSIEDDREVSKAEEFGLRTVRGPGGKRRVIDTTEGNGRNDELSGEPTDPDKAGNIHIAAKRLGGGKPLFADAQELDGGGEKTGRQLMADKRDTRPNEKLINKSNMDGSGHYVQDRTNFLETMRATARDLARPGTAGAKAMGAKLEKLLRSDINLAEKDQERMLALTLPEVNTARKSEIISDLSEKYADVLRKRGPQKIGKVIAGKEQKTPEYEGEFESDDYSSSEPYFDAPLGEPGEAPSAATVTKPAVLRAPVTMLEKAVAQRMKALTPQSAAAHESWAQKELASGRARNGDEAAALNSLIETARGTREGSPDPKSVAAKKAAFLSRVASGDETLLAELASSTDAKGLQRAAATLAGPVRRVVPEKYRKNVREYLDHVLGVNAVDLVFDSATLDAANAGALHERNDKTGRETIIAASETYADLIAERGLMYHESAHALFARLLVDKRFRGSAEIMVRVAKSDKVQKQLFDLYRDDPAALRHFRNNPEEAVAYMYQHWADGSLVVADKPTVAIFERIKAFLTSFLQTMSDEAHVDAMFQFFKDGDLKNELAPFTSADLYRSQLLSEHKGYINYGKRNETLDAVNARLSELVQDPDMAYGLGTQSYSNESTDPTKNNAANPQPGRDIRNHIEKVLGKSVKLEWAKFTHAGEFQRMKTGDIIRLSVFALNPMSTAYHESLHAFIAQLRDAGAHDVVDVLYKAARAPQVLKQLNEIYKDQPAVLEQLKDPEERVAYMYQVWASGSSALTVGPVTRNVFQKMADFIRSVLGIWSNDQRALHIMRYFNDGSYAQSMGMPNATHRALMDPGRNKAIEMAKTFTVPLGKLADALLSTGDARLRDTNIPALRELADLIKRQSTEEGGDQGYIPAARLEATKRMGAMAEALAGYSPEDLQQALQALQTKAPAATPEAAAAAVKIKAILRDTKNYMEFAGVKLGDLGPDYFPRVWDTHYVSQNEQALRDMLEPYVRSGEFKGNPSDFIRSLTSRAGNEFGIETSTPGMQFKKKRELDFLKPADVAPFLEKDLMGVMASYIGQATRRAEWDRRLGQFDEDTKETKLMALMRQAKAQGASTEQLNMTTDYLKGVDGTLGDSINPHARRIMGNMIVYQNIRLLPMAMFSMLIDPMGVLVRGGTVGEAFKTFKRGMASIPETYGRKTQADEATKLAELVGVIDTAVLNHVMGDVYTQGMVGGTAKKINNMFFKYNMVEGLNRSFRVGASEAAMSFIARHADLKGRHSKRWMAELGLVAGDVVMVGNRIALTQAEGLTPSQERRVHAAINQWVDGAMLRPDAADKPIWMNDPHYALISHLKQFVFSFQKTILNRMVHELKHGNYAPAMALASYVPMMIAADTAKGLIQNGGDEPEWKKSWGVAEYVGYGVQRAGLLGVGQFGLDVVSDAQRGGSGIGALAGPTLEQMADAVQLLGGRKQFGPMLLDAMPANALYKDVLGGDSDGGPMRTG